MAKGRKVRDTKEAQALLAKWSTSGQRMSEWCESRGISWYSLSAYQGWQRARTRGAALVEVVAAAPELAGPVEVPAARYRIVLRDCAVEVDDRFDDDTLQRLLRVVAAC
jgi:hypothetical protein